MAYDFEKDASAKSFEMKLDNETIMTAFVTTDEDAGDVLPELSDGVYGGIGYGPMGPDWEPLGGGGSGDFTIAEVTFATAASGIAIAVIDEDGSAVLAYATEGSTHNAILYKGTQVVFVDDIDDWEVSGNATIDAEEDTIIITGNCTITSTK